MRYLKKVFLAMLLMAGYTAFAQNTFTVDAPRVVGQDEIFRVVFTANGEIESFTNPQVTGAEILAGPSPSRMQSTQIINGQRSERLEISYTFILRPTGEGVAKIGAATATIGGKSYSTNELSIEVVKGESQQSGNQQQQGVAGGNAQAQQRTSTGEVSSKDVFLKLSFSKNKVVKGEPIIATLKLYTRVPIAGFEDIKFPVFNGFWSQEIETPQNINFVRENVDNQIYNSAVLRRYMLLPQQTGDLAVKPAEMICQVQVRSSYSGGRSIFDDFFDSGYQVVKKRVSSAESTIKVSPLPAGAPASFGQGVGNFSLKVDLSRDSVKAHEAGSLIVTVEGSGNLNLIEAPKVELPADFELYDVKTSNNYSYGSNGIQGSKTFEYPFIPRSEGVFEVPPVEYSYYDIKSGKYVTLKSLPVEIKVAKGDGQVTSGSLVQGISKQAVANLGEDIRYIQQGGAGLVGKGKFFVGSLGFFIALALVAAIYAALYFALQKRAKLKGDVVRTRNRKANKVAKKRLKLAEQYMQQNLRAPFYEEMHKALLGYISDKLAIQFADMQRDTIMETMQAKGVSQANIADFMQILEDCEMARYSMGGGAGEMSAQYEKAISVISNLEGEL
ncbi:MAG: protein BatD [Bacteroidales bacterium]|nr:protein BatD [Bacteroidales bacterium]